MGWCLFFSRGPAPIFQWANSHPPHSFPPILLALWRPSDSGIPTSGARENTPRGGWVVNPRMDGPGECSPPVFLGVKLKNSEAVCTPPKKDLGLCLRVFEIEKKKVKAKGWLLFVGTLD